MKRKETLAERQASLRLQKRREKRGARILMGRRWDRYVCPICHDVYIVDCEHFENRVSIALHLEEQSDFVKEVIHGATAQ